MKSTKPTYENFTKCFAGIYAKHSATKASSMFTCYVRGAIRDYVYGNDTRRQKLAEDGVAEDACGVRIAMALLRQGWTDDQIANQSDEMQDRVDQIEDNGSPLNFTEQIEECYGYPLPGCRIQNDDNRLRWQWLHNGAEYIEYTPEE